MSITNYTELQTAVASWLSRADLTSLIPDFIALAEAKFQRELRTRNMEAIVSITPSSGVCALPADFLQARRVYVNADEPYELEYLTPENFYLKYPVLTTWSVGPSRYYTIQGSNLYLSDIASGNDISLLYYQEIPDLATNSTNWLLTNHPDLYLYGALFESTNKTKNREDRAFFTEAMNVVLGQIAKSDKHGKFSGSAMRVISA
jgi:hypothetical protein